MREAELQPFVFEAERFVPPLSIATVLALLKLGLQTESEDLTPICLDPLDLPEVEI